MICTYKLNCLLVCRTFIHVCTYMMILCNYNAFLSIEILCWIRSNWAMSIDHGLSETVLDSIKYM